MPDIAMCKGDDCSKKMECYRHRAIPTPRRQSYFAKPPMHADGSCTDFMSLRKGDRLADGTLVGMEDA